MEAWGHKNLTWFLSGYTLKQIFSSIAMLKAVLVLLMVSACISKPKHYLIETKDMHHGKANFIRRQAGLFYYFYILNLEAQKTKTNYNLKSMLNVDKYPVS